MVSFSVSPLGVTVVPLIWIFEYLIFFISDWWTCHSHTQTAHNYQLQMHTCLVHPMHALATPGSCYVVCINRTERHSRCNQNCASSSSVRNALPGAQLPPQSLTCNLGTSWRLRERGTLLNTATAALNSLKRAPGMLVGESCCSEACDPIPALIAHTLRYKRGSHHQ